MQPNGIGLYTFFPMHIQYGVLKYNDTFERGMNMSEEVRGGYGYPGFTSTGAILVLFILLVIISRSLFV
ncbi:hypothetical protein M2105_003720 [Paenibacillus sp. PastF-1]|nr:hypothetical protein [Paenibacillus sp. PastF-2]MDF9849438.1 hypothetical protein [Paenibacillus sp. PastM-2]MDF9855854.1 hypothetical protein [Paenibacillus sp. PastF-1]MDH6481280.1 hypothetical protein [Paenibacillus sp. PastH-2]MDH6508699.1 hypothetical protein [Paenibacillus sp. PastM-3]